MSKDLPDSDDFFSDTRMSFGDHIEDLRTHLWRAAKGFGVALVFSFFIGHIVLAYMTLPVKEQLRAFHKRRVDQTMRELETNSTYRKANRPTEFTPILVLRDQLRAAVGDKPIDEVNATKRPVLVDKDAKAPEEKSWWDRLTGNGDNAPPEDPEVQKINPDQVVKLWVAHAEPLRYMGLLQEAMGIVGDFDTMSTLNVQETFMVWFKVCLVCGLVLGSPWIFWQIWSFVAAGVDPHEKRYVHVYLPISLFLFLIGVTICELFVIPKAIEALLWFNEWLGYKPDLRLNEWLGFAVFMPVVFGLSFQTPLVMLFLNKIGVVNVKSFQNKRRYFWFAMAVFAAVITPSTDALSMLFLWVPMSLLFELGIVLIRFSHQKPDLDVDVPDAEEMVEV
jgi:sec-independent protein translocase protein TatC